MIFKQSVAEIKNTPLTVSPFQFKIISIIIGIFMEEFLTKHFFLRY
ncbi:hypothetical protein [Bacillus sp. SM2101]|nr:hypothetical protein [Bacillus sp. SM2101]